MTDLSLWPSNPTQADFLDQSEPIQLKSRIVVSFWVSIVATFLGQSNQLDPNSTLYAIFFGIK